MNFVDFNVVQPKKKKSNINYYFWGSIAASIILVLSVTIFLVTYFNGPCGVNKVEDSTEKLSEIYKKWEVAYSLASATPKDSLSSSIESLQNIEKEASDLETPACMDTVKENTVNGMVKFIEGFLLRSNTSSPDSEINARFYEGIGLLKQANDDITEINQCAPFCE